MPRKIVEHVETTKSLPFVTLCSLNDDETISLFFDNGKSFIITPTDYPSGAAFYFCEQTSESGAIEGSLPDKIYPQLLKLSGAAAAAKNTTNTLSTNGSGNGVSMTQEDSSDSGMGANQQSSQMVMAYSDDAGDDEGALAPELLRDLELADKKFNYKTRHERIALGVRVTVEFYLADLVSESTAMAWGFNRGTPFHIRIQFERPEYIKSEKPPEILIFQDGKPCRFGQQIKNFVHLYITSHWNRSGWVAPLPPDYGDNDDGASDGKKGSTGSSGFQKLLDLLTPPQRIIYDQLLRMGFKEKLAAPAARQSSTIDEAVDKCTNGTVLAEGTTMSDSRSWLDSLKQKTGLGGTDDKGGAALATNNPISLRAFEGNREESNSGMDPKKFVPFRPEDEGWLVHIVKYIRKRVPTAHTFCVICDNSHLIGAGMLKPCVCERELCTFGFQNLKVGADSASSVATGGGTIDLLVSCFRNAVESARRDLILEPYPQIADPDTGKLVFDPKNKDFVKLAALTAQLPPTKDLLGVESLDQLTSKLVGKDKLLFPLLEWIISSNRSLIVKLRSEQIIKKMATLHQFLLVSASPEKQKRFDDLKEKYGSFLAWHGSSLENFHCILRCGLRNYSNKGGYMTAGAALGPGVYCAIDAATSMGYSRAQGISGVGKQSDGREDGGYFDGAKAGQIAILILIEVAKDPSGYKDHGNVKTIQNEDAIMTRFFFVFTSNDQVSKATGINTTEPSFEKEIRALIAAT